MKKSLNMKGRISILFVLTLLCVQATGQTLKKTYYDYQNTNVKEVYYVNSRGEKNGSYKSYYEDGLIGVESNYLNGNRHGLYKEYQWGGSKTYLNKQETYKDGVLHGPAKYYGGEDLSIVVSRGNYVDGKEDGVWTFVEKVANGFYFPKGFQYCTNSATYAAGVKVSIAPIVKYYPAGKTYIENVYANEKPVTSKVYFPSGQLAKMVLYDDKDRVISENEYFEDGKQVSEIIASYSDEAYLTKIKEWYNSGQLKFSKTLKDGKEVSYEGYNEDGSHDKKMEMFIDAQREREQDLKTQRIVSLEKQAHADTLFIQRKYSEAKREYGSLITELLVYEDRNEKSGDTTNDDFLYGIYQHCQNRLKEIETISKQLVEVADQYELILAKHKSFVASYVVRKTLSTGVSTQSISKDTYPYGKFLFEKAEAYYQSLWAQWSVETEISKGLEIGNEIVRLLNKMSGLSKTNTSALNKQLKKVTTTEETKQILGL